MEDQRVANDVGVLGRDRGPGELRLLYTWDSFVLSGSGFLWREMNLV